MPSKNPRSATAPLIAVPPWFDDSVHPLARSIVTHAQSLLALALHGFLIGYVSMYTIWVQVCWLLVIGLPTVLLIDWQPILPRLGRDKFMLMSAAFLGWMTWRSRCLSWPGSYDAMRDAALGLVGVLMLGLLLLVIWLHSARDESPRRAGELHGFIAAAVAVISIVTFYFLLPNHHWGERLQNVLVNGGLHPVCTGLVFGFAALWLNTLWDHTDPWRVKGWKILAVGILLLACFLTTSRGTLIALVCGHGALMIGRGWRQALAPCALSLAIAMLYIAATPLIGHLWHLQIKARAETTATVEMPAEVARPVFDLIERRDAGRLEIYQAGLSTLGTVQERIIGIGQWGTRERWANLLAPEIDHLLGHLHSAFLATFVHGGAIGLTLLVGILGIGFHRARALARKGDAVWLALAAFGCGGLLCDGQTMCSLTSLPKFETLILWFPLATASSIWYHRNAPHALAREPISDAA